MKKICSLLLILILAVSLSACGEKNPESDSGTGNSVIQNDTDIADANGTEQNKDTSSSDSNISSNISTQETDITTSTAITDNPSTNSTETEVSSTTSDKDNTTDSSSTNSTETNMSSTDTSDKGSTTNDSSTNSSEKECKHYYDKYGKCIRCKKDGPDSIKYDCALNLINTYITSPTKSGAELQKAYDMLVRLGGYKDAQDYLSKFEKLTVLKKTNQTETNAFGETMNNTVTKNTSREYNSQGQLIQLYDGFFTILYTYNELGLIDEETYKIGKANSDTEFVVKYTYDTRGKATHVTRTTKSGKVESRELVYDTKGRLISGWEFTSSLIGSFRYVYIEYDQYDNIIKETKEIGNNTYKYKYENGNISECEIRSKNDKDFNLVTYLYQNNRLIKTVDVYYPDSETKGYTTTTEYIYEEILVYLENN